MIEAPANWSVSIALLRVEGFSLPAATQSSTPSARPARMRASLTGRIGGESIRTRASVARRASNREAERTCSISVALAVIGPLGSTVRPGYWVFARRSFGSILPLRAVERPTSLRMLKISC